MPIFILPSELLDSSDELPHAVAVRASAAAMAHAAVILDTGRKGRLLQT